MYVFLIILSDKCLIIKLNVNIPQYKKLLCNLRLLENNVVEIYYMKA